MLLKIAAWTLPAEIIFPGRLTIFRLSKLSFSMNQSFLSTNSIWLWMIFGYSIPKANIKALDDEKKEKKPCHRAIHLMLWGRNLRKTNSICFAVPRLNSLISEKHRTNKMKSVRIWNNCSECAFLTTKAERERHSWVRKCSNGATGTIKYALTISNLTSRPRTSQPLTKHQKFWNRTEIQCSCWRTLRIEWGSLRYQTRRILSLSRHRKAPDKQHRRHQK